MNGLVRMLCIGFIVISLLCSSGCRPETKVVKLPPMAVTTARPIERDVYESVEFTGRTEGSELVDIRARVSGYLTKIHFKPGTLVNQGDLLFEIDDRPYKIALEQAEGEVDRNTAKLTRIQLDLDKAEELLTKKAGTRQEVDRILGDKGETEATLRSARAAADRARLDLTWTQIVAPITGLVSRELITAGNLVTADQTKLTTLVRQDPMYVYFDIDERTVLRILQLIKEGKFKSARQYAVPIQMALGNNAADEFPYEGYVNFVDNRLDATTGTMRIRGTFANPMMENGSINFAAGMFARVRINLSGPYPALMITERAILADQGQKYVYVCNEKNEIERRDVVLGKLENPLREIASGISKSDRVVINGIQRIRPGVSVDPKESPALANSPTPKTSLKQESANE